MLTKLQTIIKSLLPKEKIQPRKMSKETKSSDKGSKASVPTIDWDNGE